MKCLVVFAVGVVVEEVKRAPRHLVSPVVFDENDPLVEPTMALK